MRISLPLVCRHKFESSHFPSKRLPHEAIGNNGVGCDWVTQVCVLVSLAPLCLAMATVQLVCEATLEPQSRNAYIISLRNILGASLYTLMGWHTVATHLCIQNV